MSRLLNSLKTTLALLATVIVCFTPLPSDAAQPWASRDNKEAIAFLSPKVDDSFLLFPQHEKQTAAILGTVAVRGSGRIKLPNC
jgi:hypothetical protein